MKTTKLILTILSLLFISEYAFCQTQPAGQQQPYLSLSYDNNGNRIQQNFINVRNLTTGLYLISVKTNTGNSYCEKLSVVR